MAAAVCSLQRRRLAASVSRRGETLSADGVCRRDRRCRPVCPCCTVFLFFILFFFCSATRRPSAKRTHAPRSLAPPGRSGLTSLSDSSPPRWSRTGIANDLQPIRGRIPIKKDSKADCCLYHTEAEPELSERGSTGLVLVYAEAARRRLHYICCFGRGFCQFKSREKVDAFTKKKKIQFFQSRICFSDFRILMLPGT